MIDSVQITGSYGNAVILDLWDDHNGYFVKEIEGLGPVDADLVSTEYANFDGAQFQSSRRSARNIVFHIGFSNKSLTFSAEELRKNLSAVFRPKSQIDMIFRSDKNYKISGIVESNAPAIFAKEPSAIVSVMCYDPDFLLENDITRTWDGLVKPSGFSISYKGTEPSGIFMNALIMESVDTSVIVKKTHEFLGIEQMHLIGLPSNGAITFNLNTAIGSRNITKSDGSSLLHTLQTGSLWIQLYPGTNQFSLEGQFSDHDQRIVYTYSERYGTI